MKRNVCGTCKLIHHYKATSFTTFIFLYFLTAIKKTKHTHTHFEKQASPKTSNPKIWPVKSIAIF